MNNTLLLCAGGAVSAPLLYDFAARNQAYLNANGVCFPHAFAAPERWHYPLDIALGGALMGHATCPSLHSYMEATQRACAHAGDDATNLWISGIDLFTCPPEAFATLYRDLQQRFSGFTIRCFVHLARRDVELETLAGIVAISKIIVSLSQLQKWLPYQLVNYDCLWPVQRMFGQQHSHIYFFDSIEKEIERFPAALLHAGGLLEDGSADAALSPPLYFHNLPRELLAFICAVNGALFYGQSGNSPLAWGKQLLNFTAQAGYTSSGHSLFGPAWRKEVKKANAKSDEQLAKRFGDSAVFSTPDLEPEWEPWIGFSDDSAHTVAERLDKNFVRDLLDRFDTVSPYYLDRDQRLIYAALQDAMPCSYQAVLPRRMPEPKVSVLTLTYNHADFIEKNIQSVLEQTTDFPINHIIADDGSDDETREIIINYAARHPHIIPVFQKKRSHGFHAVRALFAMARSEYVALCDGDDYFTDCQKLQTQADFLDTYPECALCFHPVQVVYEDGTSRSRVYPPLDALPRGVRPFYYLTDLLRFNMIQTNSVMYRWRFRNGLPEWFRADLTPGDWYWHILHAEMGKIGFINKIMAVYRRHKKSVYYSAEINTRIHRDRAGGQELEVYSAVNKHFNGKYASILGDMANGVLASLLLHAQETGDSGIFDSMIERYPEFAAHFLASIKKVQRQDGAG